MLQQIIFLHVPKTAGTSLRSALDQFFKPSEKLYLYEGLAFDKIEDYRRQAAHARLIFGHLSIGAHHDLQIKPCYGTMLRHPVQRVVSLFYHFARDPASPFFEEIRNGMTLSELIKSGRTEQTNNHFVRNCMGWSGELPRHIFEEKYLSRALALIEAHFAYIGIQEAFTESLQKFSDLMGCPMPQSVPRLNEREDSVEALSADDYDCIAEYNNLDIRLYEMVTSEKLKLGWECPQ